MTIFTRKLLQAKTIGNRKPVARVGVEDHISRPESTKWFESVNTALSYRICFGRKDGKLSKNQRLYIDS